MSFCSNCGNEIPEGAKFCANCGVPAGKVIAGSENNATVTGTAFENSGMNTPVQPPVNNKTSYQQHTHRPQFYMKRRSNSWGGSKLDMYGKYIGIGLLIIAVVTFATDPPIFTIALSAAIIAGAIFCLAKRFELKGFPIAAIVLASFCLLSGVGQASLYGMLETPDNDGSAKNIVEGLFEKTNGIGDTVKYDGINITLVDVENSYGAKYFGPDDGNVYVICEFEIANNSDETINVSSIANFNAYVDGYSTDESITAVTATDKKTLNGTVAPGKKLNGVLCYEVSEDWEKLEIIYTPDFWSDKNITFKVYN
ncbi:MAG: DUF4352 domain-containing protein [Clostridiales bacterium]|nr:DUF4352 domain-containing protein [Clostridiales bacterium]